MQVLFDRKFRHDSTLHQPPDISMQLIVNGDVTDVKDGITIRELIQSLDLTEKGLAVERNLEIVPKSKFDDLILVAGDRLEIIQFVGGG